MTKTHLLITGASRGIGKAIVKAFAARHGRQLRLSLLARNSESLQLLREELTQDVQDVHCYAIDVNDHQKLMHTIADIDDNCPVNIGIINAGISGNTRHGWEPWEQVKGIIDTNLLGLMATVQPLVPRMEQRQQGKIVLISSISAYRGMAMTPSYCASKAAVMSYAESLRGWLQPSGVKVITVLPGFVESDMSDHFSGPKLMMISAQQAAEKIASSIENNRTIVAFPFWMVLGIRLLAWLPAGLGDRILQQLGYGRKT